VRGRLTALLKMLTEAFPRAPVIVVICDNDSIHHARTVTAYLDDHPRLELLYGGRYSPHDNPVEPVWAGLKNYVANTAVSWPGRLRQIHAFFRNRSPSQMLATAAPWTSPSQRVDADIGKRRIRPGRNPPAPVPD
jgi:hypothetical protein